MSALKTQQWRIQDPPALGGGGGGNSWDYGENLLFGKIFVENCMKMIEIGQRGGRL